MVFGVVCGPYFNLNATTFKTAGHKKSECSTTENDGGGQCPGDSEKVMEFQEVTPSCTLPISRKKQGDWRRVYALLRGGALGRFPWLHS